MAKELKDLTKSEENYSQWYNDLVVKAGLAENSAVRGCMVIKPYGYAIWEKMQAILDRMFKQTGHEIRGIRTPISRSSSPSPSSRRRRTTSKASPRSAP